LYQGGKGRGGRTRFDRFGLQRKREKKREKKKRKRKKKEGTKKKKKKKRKKGLPDVEVSRP